MAKLVNCNASFDVFFTDDEMARCYTPGTKGKENEEFENEGKNSNTVLNDGESVEIFLHVWRISCIGY